MAKRGRKARLSDPELRKKVLNVIKLGASRRTAAKYVGIAVSTIDNEADRDKSFKAELEQAEAACEIYHLSKWRKGEKGWIAHAAFLGRKWPARWGRQRETPQRMEDDLPDSEEVKLMPMTLEGEKVVDDRAAGNAATVPQAGAGDPEPGPIHDH